MRLNLVVAASLTAIIATPSLANQQVEQEAELPAVGSTVTAKEEPVTPTAPVAPKINSEAAENAIKSENTEKAAKADERICRYIRADSSSRRKSKVCLTAKEWRNANRGN